MCPCQNGQQIRQGEAVFEVDLTDGVNIKDLKGEPLTVTMIDGKGQSETTMSS